MKSIRYLRDVRRTAGVIALTGVLLAGCSGSTEGLFGRELYDKSCEPCHGSSGQGTAAGDAIDAGSPAAELSDEQLAGVIEVGPGAMPGYGRRLSPDQIDSLVDYMRQLQAGAAGDE